MRLAVTCRKTQAAKTYLYVLYKSINAIIPTYLSDLIPPSVGEISTYTLRNQHNITVPLCRTKISRKSCIPSSISAWNSLDIELRNSPSLASFKYQLKKLQNNSSVPTYYRTGSRYLSVLHARIRNNCSNLLSDLYINHCHLVLLVVALKRSKMQIIISLIAQTTIMKEMHF